MTRLLVELLLYPWMGFCCTHGWASAVPMDGLLLYPWMGFCCTHGWALAGKFSYKRD